MLNVSDVAVCLVREIIDFSAVISLIAKSDLTRKYCSRSVLESGYIIKLVCCVLLSTGDNNRDVYTDNRKLVFLTRDKMASMLTWLPLVRAAAVGWVPLSANPIPVSAPIAAAIDRRASSIEVSADSRLRINISGQRFEAWRCTIDRFPNTLLGSDEKEFFFEGNASSACSLILASLPGSEDPSYPTRNVKRRGHLSQEASFLRSEHKSK